MASEIPCIDLRTPSPALTHDEGDGDDLMLEENSESFLASRKRPYVTPRSASDSEGNTSNVHVSNKQKVVEVPVAASGASSSTAIVQENMIDSRVPHCRHKCPVHLFDKSARSMNVGGCFDYQTKINIQTCQECYCFICDTQASSCADWVTHCNASDCHPVWINLRDRHGVPLLIDMQGDALTLLSRKTDNFPSEYDTDKLGLEYPLKTWQKMMVTFMVNIEQNGISPDLFRPRESHDVLPSKIFGGLVACEVGMGKTAAVLSLILAHPLTGVTLFVVPPLLVRQTVLEMKKFNKNISVDFIYGKSAAEQNQRRMVADQVDVVVISSGSKLADCLELKVGRVIFDEAHILDTGLMPRHSRVFNLDFLSGVRHVWCISGTPLEHRFDDKALLAQGRLLLKMPVVFARSTATLFDAQRLIFRLTKDAFPEHKWPSVVYKKLSASLSDKQRQMYDFLCCCEKKAVPDDSESETINFQRFSDGTLRRRLFLSENYSSLKDHLRGVAFCDTMESSNLLAYSKRWDAIYHDFFNNGGQNDTSKLDAVIHDILNKRKLHSNYVPIVVTENTGIASHFRSSSGLRIGVLQPPACKAKYDENDVKQRFEDGEYDVLICSFMPMSLGLNLQRASELFFIDLVTNESVYKQSLGRISRLSSLHDQVVVTAVCVKDTIGEVYCDFWEDRRKGVSLKDAGTKLWQNDRRHCMEDDPCIFYRPITYPHRKNGKFFSMDASSFSLCVNNIPSSESNALMKLTISDKQYFMLYSPHCTGFRVTLKIERWKWPFDADGKYVSNGSVNGEYTFNIDRSCEIVPSTSSSSSSMLTHTFEVCIPFDIVKFRPDPDTDAGYYVYPQHSNSKSKCFLSVDYIIVKDGRPAIFCPLVDNIIIGKCSATHCSLCGCHRDIKLLDVQMAGDRKINVDGVFVKDVTDGLSIMVDRGDNACSLSLNTGMREEHQSPTDNFIDFMYEQSNETMIKYDSPIAVDAKYNFKGSVTEYSFITDLSFTSAVICLPDDAKVGDMVEYMFNNKQQVAYVDEIIVIPSDDGELKNCVKTWVKNPRADKVIQIMSSKKKF